MRKKQQEKSAREQYLEERAKSKEKNVAKQGRVNKDDLDKPVKKRGKKSRMNEQELNQQEVEAAENAAETETAESEVVDVAALTAAAAKADEYLALAQRTQADFDNFRRRNESVRADAFADGQRTVAKAMLAVLDNLERALAAPAAEGDALRTGVEMTHKQMIAALEKLGVSVIDRVGERFDPNIEDAVMQGSSEEGEPGTVCAVFQKGYKMGDQLHRFANGIDDSPVLEHPEKAKGYSNSTTLENDVTGVEEAYKILLALADSTASRMRADGARAFCVSVTVRTNDFKDRSHQRKLNSASAQP